MMLSRHEAVAAFAHAARGHGTGILAIIVIAAAAFGAYRLIERRRSRGEVGGSIHDQWPSRPAKSSPDSARRAGESEAAPRLIGGSEDNQAEQSRDDAGGLPADVGRPGTRTASAPFANASRNPTNGWAIETHGLTKNFGANVAVDDVELLVPRGSAFGYLGPNGAGKTTLMRTLLGLTKADKGTMALLGIPVPSDRRQALARVGAIVDEPRFYGHLTGRENLQMLAAARGTGAAERIAPSLRRVRLTERADHTVASYSMGMRQRLGVASCLLGDPELLILDEPMNGLDPAGMHEMRLMIRSLVDEGRTVMLSSHLLDEVERTCDAVAIVEHGRVIRQGPIDELVRGAGAAVAQIQCSDPAAAARLIDAAGIAASTSVDELGLNVTLPVGASRELLGDINRRLVEGGIAVYRLVEARASLEDWFLSVTSRFGAPS